MRELWKHQGDFQCVRRGGLHVGHIYKRVLICSDNIDRKQNRIHYWRN